MTVPVRYHCPRCATIVTVQRDPYLSDKSVTSYPLEGWRYADPDENFEREDFDGVRFVCGETPDGAALEWDGEGCGEPFYLSFVRFEDGREVEPDPESEYVRLAEGLGPGGPHGPTGPRGPPSPGGPDSSGGPEQ